MHYINNWCRVSGGKVAVNGFTVLEGSPFGFLNHWYDHLQPAYPKFYKMDQLCQLGFLAAEALFSGAQKYAPESVDVVLANAGSCLDTDREYLKTMQSIPSPAVFVYTLPNIVIGEICIRHHFKGENVFFVLEKFDAETLSDYTEILLKNNPDGAVLAGWVEVLDGDYDALLYLVENTAGEDALLHNKQTISELYGILDERLERANN